MPPLAVMEEITFVCVDYILCTGQILGKCIESIEQIWCKRSGVMVPYYKTLNCIAITNITRF